MDSRLPGILLRVQDFSCERFRLPFIHPTYILWFRQCVVSVKKHPMTLPSPTMTWIAMLCAPRVPGIFLYFKTHILYFNCFIISQLQRDPCNEVWDQTLIISMIMCWTTIVCQIWHSTTSYTTWANYLTTLSLTFLIY